MSGAVASPSQAAQARTVVVYALREALRRRLFPVVAILTLVFLVLYALGAHFAFREVEDTAVGFGVEIDDRSLAGATLLGLAMFGTLFLGAVLTTFLTLGVIRGDAESGLMQPIAARPISRPTILGARCLGAGLVSASYAVLVFFAAVAITSAIGGWEPDRPLQAALLLAGAVIVITCLSAVASAFTGSTAQGVSVLMLFGAGLTAGLLGQIGDALGSERLVDVSEVASRALPFQALYQDALYSLTADVSGATGFLLSLGPFGGAVDGGSGLIAWSILYCAGMLALAAWMFVRRDI